MYTSDGSFDPRTGLTNVCPDENVAEGENNELPQLEQKLAKSSLSLSHTWHTINLIPSLFFILLS